MPYAVAGAVKLTCIHPGLAEPAQESIQTYVECVLVKLEQHEKCTF